MKEKLEIKNIKKIRLKPNDVLLVTAPKSEFRDGEWCERAHRELQKLFPDNNILIEADTVKFTVISPVEAMLIKMEQSK